MLTNLRTVAIRFESGMIFFLLNGPATINSKLDLKSGEIKVFFRLHRISKGFEFWDHIVFHVKYYATTIPNWE